MSTVNGSDDSQDDSFVMDNKPIVTCAGEMDLWRGLENALVCAMPQEASEWRRARGVRSVNVTASFVPFSVSALPKEGNWDLIRQPILHIYWIECTDVDVYKTVVRDELETWLKELNRHKIIDWMIVVVEMYDAKRTNKLLPRTTVLDKIRSDFAAKQGDRCISVINPLKSEFRSADSWRGLVTRMRVLLLDAYARALDRLEDYVREQRERRNQPSWDFCQYFLTQEELALVLEMLGLYDEALIQYDELDALFSQFVVNAAHAGPAVFSDGWLDRFRKPTERWWALELGKPLTREQRSAVLAQGPAPLLEFRAYLFSRQAAMLLLLCKPWELAQRCLPFLHTCIQEVALLDVSIPPGALSCWLFLACLEVLQTCDRYTDSEQIEAYSLHTAELWAYASSKLRSLGLLCGLQPGGREPTSEQLHIVVGLSAGMGDRTGSPEHPTPTDKLKQALCSEDAFDKMYLELAELAMGTFKHVGRIRSARLMGCELAQFYLQKGQPQNAATFLQDAVRMYSDEQWRDLSAQVQLELANCCDKENDPERFTLICIAIASASELELLVRNFYFDEMIKSMKLLSKMSSEPLNTMFGDAFKIQSIVIKDGNFKIMQDNDINVTVELESNFPREIWCDRVLLSVEKDHSKKSHCKYNSSVNFSEVQTCSDASLKQLSVVEHLDRKQDGQVGSANVVCKQLDKEVRRNESVTKYDIPALGLECKNIGIKPGLNTIHFTLKSSEPGIYRLGKLFLFAERIKFMSPVYPVPIGYCVIRQDPEIRLDKVSSELVAGIRQNLKFTVINGSFLIEKDSVVKLRTSKCLTMKRKDSEENLSREITLLLPTINPFESVSFIFEAFCELPSKKDDKHIENIIIIQNSWSSDDRTINLHFSPLFKSMWRLHTALTRKFIQITVTGLTNCSVCLSQPMLQCSGVKLTPLNVINGQPLVVTKGLDVSFMWELQMDDLINMDLIKSEFAITYSVFKLTEEQHSMDYTGTYKFVFDISNYKTLFIVRSLVEPIKGAEFCRSGTMCHLRLTVERTDSNEHFNDALMYEVLADQSTWAVCGRTAGVVAFNVLSATDGSGDPRPNSQTVMLDVMPLCSGHVPLPLVRLSKYIPANQGQTDKSRKPEPTAHPRLEPFSTGQVYNISKAQQVHVLPAVVEGNVM